MQYLVTRSWVVDAVDEVQAVQDTWSTPPDETRAAPLQHALDAYQVMIAGPRPAADDGGNRPPAGSST